MYLQLSPKSRILSLLGASCALILSSSTALALNSIQVAPTESQTLENVKGITVFRLYAIGHGNEGQYAESFNHFDYANPEAPKGGMIKLSEIGSFNNLEPFSLRKSGIDIDLLYDQLFVSPRDDPLTAYPLIAESAMIADDHSFVVFNLNPSAKWQDDSPITSDDVVFTFNLLTRNDQAIPFFRTAYKDVTDVGALGPYKVKFALSAKDATSLIFLIGSMHILPRHYYEARSFGTDSLEAPLGSGPYSVTQVLPGRRIQYQRVTDYWARDLPVRKGLYNFDTWVVDYYRDANVRAQAFMAGLIDVMFEFDPGRWLLYDEASGKTGVPMVKQVSQMRGALGSMNFAFNLRRPPFDDRVVREAVTELFDYEWIDKVLLSGWADRNHTQFPNSELAAAGPPTQAELALLLPWRDRIRKEILDDAYVPPASDGSGFQRERRRRALKLFSEAGYTIRNGRLVNGEGRQLSIEIITANADAQNIILTFVASLRRVGIDARLRLVDAAQFEQRSRADFDFDMTFHYFRSTEFPGADRERYWASEFANTKYTLNIPGVQDPAVDDLVRRIRQASTREDLVAATRALDRLIAWNAYILPGWYIGSLHYAYWNRFGRADQTVGTDVRRDIGWPAIEAWWAKHDTVPPTKVRNDTIAAKS
ncbi:ABC transporter [Skermanella aerolata]|uniref:ABC transporter n=1 Tax=Skermanella aerolata TaxID=393310 RepID=A0A512DUB8_9PROT|nr:hypothetical protein N826_19415 [Skermanella aerolata KACC 11604]GEO40058.1 ABC transporter [Skermanella aerolata]